MWRGKFCRWWTTPLSKQSSPEPQVIRGLQASTGNKHDCIRAVRKSDCRSQGKKSETENGKKQNGKPGSLSAPIRNYGDVFAVIFFHRRGAKGAERKYFLFTVERTANEKKNTLCALCGEI